MIWTGLLVAALVEPVFQVVAGFSDPVLRWATAYVGLHVFLISAAQLAIFKRYDFVSMYAFRLVYYLFWHIVWGYLRLEWLF